MTTNREWLYSLTPGELAAWFDAEHMPDYVNNTLADYQQQRIDNLIFQRDGLIKECDRLAGLLIEAGYEPPSYKRKSVRFGRYETTVIEER